MTKEEFDFANIDGNDMCPICGSKEPIQLGKDNNCKCLKIKSLRTSNSVKHINRYHHECK